MKKRLGRLVLLGAVIGGVAAARGYLNKGAPVKEVAQIVFDDGSTRAFASNTAGGEELVDLARKLVESGV